MKKYSEAVTDRRRASNREGGPIATRWNYTFYGDQMRRLFSFHGSNDRDSSYSVHLLACSPPATTTRMTSVPLSGTTGSVHECEVASIPHGRTESKESIYITNTGHALC
jgi:hypothetical protein